jgi:hypothetical protein
MRFEAIWMLKTAFTARRKRPMFATSVALALIWMVVKAGEV